MEGILPILAVLALIAAIIYIGSVISSKKSKRDSVYDKLRESLEIHEVNTHATFKKKK